MGGVANQTRPPRVPSRKIWQTIWRPYLHILFVHIVQQRSDRFSSDARILVLGQTERFAGMYHLGNLIPGPFGLIAALDAPCESVAGGGDLDRHEEAGGTEGDTGERSGCGVVRRGGRLNGRAREKAVHDD